MSVFIYVIVLFYILLHGMKFRRYADTSLLGVVNKIGYGIILLGTAILLGWCTHVNARSSEYIRLMVTIAPLLAIFAMIWLTQTILKYKDRLSDLLRRTYQRKSNVVELFLLTGLLFSSSFLIPVSSWFIFLSLLIFGICIVREAFLISPGMLELFNKRD